MKHYISASGEIYAFNDDGSQDHLIRGGMRQLTVSELSAARAPTLADVKATKLVDIEAGYAASIQAPITYMGAAFKCDESSQTTLAKTLVTLNAAGAAPAGFAWWDVDNTAVPMTLAELNGLSSAIFDRAWVAFKRKQALKAQVRGAVTAAEVEGVVW